VARLPFKYCKQVGANGAATALEADVHVSGGGARLTG